MKKRILLIIALLCGTSLYAQQLYFIRATADANYDYQHSLAQIIAYKPVQDTILHVYKDYTSTVNQDFVLLSSIVYYPKVETFVFSVGYAYKFYLLRTNQPDALLELIPQCPFNYDLPSEIDVINNYWAYQCYNHNAPQKKDIFIFRGIDSSLSRHFDLSASDFANQYLTGVVAQGVYLMPNDGRMYLPIVADIENRPPFSVELPQKYWVTRKLRTAILVNDDNKTLVDIKSVDPIKGEDYGRFYAALYNKDKNMWSDIVLKGNSPTIMVYGRYLAGVVQDESYTQDKSDKYAQSPDRENYRVRKTSPGKIARDSVKMENSFDEQVFYNSFYRPGILYLFNTDNLKYIEWKTGQGDSEILLVQDETVYYRVFNAIYKAPIINGEKLGKSELLVRDNSMVPWIHWAFFGKEINANDNQ